jgi:hypothetical protein
MIQRQFNFTPATAELRQRGELLKLRGMQLAADKHNAEVAIGQAAFLRALLKSASGICSIDDATDDLAVSFSDGGKWRGTVVRGLAAAGIIQRVDTVRSDRPSRHRGLLHRWRLVDREKAESRLRSLDAAGGDNERTS